MIKKVQILYKINLTCQACLLAAVSLLIFQIVVYCFSLVEIC